MIDIDSLMKGQDYSELKESYILFICKHDPFKDENNQSYGLPCYTFRNECLENPAVNLNDKSCKVIYNASAYREAKDPKIQAFLHFISTNEPGKDDFSRRLSQLVEKTKENEIFRRDYAAMNLHDRDIQRAARKEGLAEGISLGISQGAEEKAIETAKNLLKMNVLSIEQIVEASTLPMEKVLELKKAL
jgi:predicted transposase/invertase (TIGR01784 family)